MADRQDSDREVLTSLPRSRPVRRSTKRPARPATATTAAAKKKPGAKPRKAAAAKAPGAKARKAAEKKTSTPSASASTKAGVTSTAAAAVTAERVNAPRGRATPKRERGTPRPETERVAPPRKVPPAGYAAPAERGEREQGSGAAEMLSTAVQAATELTQIGLTVGRQALQSLLDRLPKP